MKKSAKVLLIIGGVLWLVQILAFIGDPNLLAFDFSSSYAAGYTIGSMLFGIAGTVLVIIGLSIALGKKK